MQITRPQPQVKFELTLNHDAQIGEQVWTEQIPELADHTPDIFYIIFVPPESRDRIMGLFIEFWDALEAR